MAKSKKINKLTPKLILLILVVLVIGIIFFLYHERDFRKVVVTNKNENTQEFTNPDSSLTTVSYAIEVIDKNTKKFSSSTYNLSFIFSASWSVQVGKATKFKDGNYAGFIKLISPSGNYLAIMPNVQTGWCEGMQCAKELFITDSGIIGNKYYSSSYPNMSVYFFKNPKETNVTLFPLLIIKSDLNSTENDKIVRSINFDF